MEKGKLLMKMPPPYDDGRVRNWVGTVDKHSMLYDWKLAGKIVRPSAKVSDADLAYINVAWVSHKFIWESYQLKLINTNDTTWVSSVIEEELTKNFSYTIECFDENEVSIEKWEITESTTSGVKINQNEITLTVKPITVVLLY